MQGLPSAISQGFLDLLGLSADPLHIFIAKSWKRLAKVGKGRNASLYLDYGH